MVCGGGGEFANKAGLGEWKGRTGVAGVAVINKNAGTRGIHKGARPIPTHTRALRPGRGVLSRGRRNANVYIIPPRSPYPRNRRDPAPSPWHARLSPRSSLTRAPRTASRRLRQDWSPAIVFDPSRRPVFSLRAPFRVYLYVYAYTCMLVQLRSLSDGFFFFFSYPTSSNVCPRPNGFYI